MRSRKKAIEFRDVFKSYKKKEIFTTKVKDVLRGVSFEVYEGEIVGLIGLNGAGKTTIIKIICGITQPDKGEVKIFPDSSSNSDLNIGYMSEIPYFCPAFTVRETLDFFYSISKMPTQNLSSLYRLSGVENYLDERVKNLSKGMLQKLALAVALVGDPQILVLDEPTAGLDPLSIKNIRDIFLRLNGDGKTIFFSSHTISEVERICNRVMIINGGKIVKTIDRNEFYGSLEDIFIRCIEYGD